LFERVELLFVVRISDYDIAFSLVQLSEVIDFRNEIFECNIFWGWSFWPFLFSIFIFLFGLFWL